jgi:hypothetical protein
MPKNFRFHLGLETTLKGMRSDIYLLKVSGFTKDMDPAPVLFHDFHMRNVYRSIFIGMDYEIPIRRRSEPPKMRIKRLPNPDKIYTMNSTLLCGEIICGSDR